MVATVTKASRIHFVTGSDEAAVKKAAMAVAHELAPDADAFGLEMIDGAVETVDASVASIHETIQSLLTLPFLGGTKLVWLKNASFFADSTAGRSDNVLAALEKLCDVLKSGLPEGISFLLSAPMADKRRTAYKLLSKLATTAVHDLPDVAFRGDEETIVEWTSMRAREHDLQLTPEAVEVLAARVGLNALQLDSELAKLETAFGTVSRISADNVRLLVPQTREGGIFDLSDAIAKRDLPLALETLRQLIHQGERGIGILLAAIVPTVRNLLLAKDLMVRHRISPPSQPHFFASAIKRLSPEETAHLPRKKDGTMNTYVLGIAATNASHYAVEELEKAFISCAAANQQLLSGSLTDEVILGRLLIGTLSRKAA
ncbi:MAG TPA: DNA polymerase III subunit delta [Terrimicrobiaceae bacterium]|nr:DNA polymerase III subunit delta [Terrimicrobiaceae bacterium]